MDNLDFAASSHRYVGHVVAKVIVKPALQDEEKMFENLLIGARA